MTTYIIKIILCSAVFYLTYKLLLEKEKMHLFNRFYLLSSLLLSFVIPVITFNSSEVLLPISQNEVLSTSILQNTGITKILSPVHSTNYLLSISLTIYVTITILLLFRFTVNLSKILSKALTHQTIPYKTSKIVLINEDLTPHSFLNYLFIYNKEYENIENEVLIHEYAHIQQKHSYDILLMEILQIVFWFNPVLFFYRKAIQLNHEYLADEAVINNTQNICNYQYLLIDKIGKNKTYNLTSQFNYSITKKRLLMMTKTKSFITVLFKQIAVIPILALSIFLFSTKTVAQAPPNVAKPKQNKIQSTQGGITQELLNEYEQIISRYKNAKGQILTEFNDTDKARLTTIYFLMSKEQQAKQSVTFSYNTPIPKNKTTDKEFNRVKNARWYNITIDDKKVDNNELEKYKPSDFSYFFIQYLAKTNKDYGKHLPLNVFIWTHKYYNDYIKEFNKSAPVILTCVKWEFAKK